MHAVLRSGALCAALLTGSCAGGSGPTAPTPPRGLSLAVSDPVPIVRVADHWITEFQVVVSDGSGQGGVVETLETTATTRAGDRELGRNVRPNAVVGLPVSVVPGIGSLALTAGLGFPLQTAAVDVRISVRVTLTDRRTATSTVSVVEVVLATDPTLR